jgi:hypothetical protein
MKNGATTLCQLKASGNTRLTVKGSLKHDGDTILVVIPSTRQLQVGDEITVYNVSGTHSGNFIVKVDDGGAGYELDASTLLTDGKLRVAAIASGINAVIAPEAQVDVYTVGGIRLYAKMPYAAVRDLLRPGTYVVKGGNTSQKIRID